MYDEKLERNFFDFGCNGILRFDFQATVLSLIL